MTLDGVVQAPSYADEDTTGGFEHGGWHTRYFDDFSMGWVIENVSAAGGYLLGRGTYEIFAAHWPNAPEEQRVNERLTEGGELVEAQARSETARRDREALVAAREPRDQRPAPNHDDTLALMFNARWMTASL